MDWDAGGMNLDETGIGETGAFSVGPPGGRDIGGHGIGGQVEDIAVPAGGQHHGMAGVPLQLAGDQIAADNAPGPAVHDHQFHHLPAGIDGDPAGGHLPHQGGVGPEQELLAGLAAGVEGPRDLGPAKGTVGQGPAVFPGKGHALGHALVDDGIGDLGQAVDIGLARAKIATLDGIVEQPEDGVPIVLIILGRVDPALGGDGMGPARTVLDAERFDGVAQLRQGGGGRGSGQTGADHQDLEFPLVGRADQFVAETAVVPFFGQGAIGDLGVETHNQSGVVGCWGRGQPISTRLPSGSLK